MVAISVEFSADALHDAALLRISLLRVAAARRAQSGRRAARAPKYRSYTREKGLKKF
jgi:hypothetical protein